MGQNVVTRCERLLCVRSSSKDKFRHPYVCVRTGRWVPIGSLYSMVAKRCWLVGWLVWFGLVWFGLALIKFMFPDEGFFFFFFFWGGGGWGLLFCLLLFLPPQFLLPLQSPVFGCLGFF